MNKKYLLACGDSFTQGHIQGKKASWATYAGPKLGLETINIACGGMSNDWICNTTLTWLMKNKEKAKDCAVVIGWSEFGRQHSMFQPVIEGDFPNTRWSTTISPWDFAPNFVDLNDPQIPQALREIEINKKALQPWFGSISDALYKTYRSILFVKEYCESNNIPYLFFDMIDNQKAIFTPISEGDNQNGQNYTIQVRNRCKNNENQWEFLNCGEVRDDQIDLFTPELTEYLWDGHYCSIRDENSVLGFIENYPNETGGGHDGEYMKDNHGHLNIEGAKWLSDYVVNWYKTYYMEETLI